MLKSLTKYIRSWFMLSGMCCCCDRVFKYLQFQEGIIFGSYRKRPSFCELNLDRRLEYPKSFETPSNKDAI